MTDWEEHIPLVKQILRSGGWTEMQEYSYEWFRDGGERVGTEWRWLRELEAGARRKGMDIYCGRKIGGWMEDAGLVDVRVTEYRIPAGF